MVIDVLWLQPGRRLRLDQGLLKIASAQIELRQAEMQKAIVGICLRRGFELFQSRFELALGEQ